MHGDGRIPATGVPQSRPPLDDVAVLPHPVVQHDREWEVGVREDQVEPGPVRLLLYVI